MAAADDIAKTHEDYLRIVDKFDYFVVGAAGALCAYVAQHYEPAKLGANPSTLELAALLILVGSVIAGFKRLEQVTILAGIRAQAAFFSGIAKGALPPQVGITPDVAERAVKSGQDKTQLAGLRAAFWYDWRNRLLLLGFLALVAARVWSPYY